MTKIDNDEIQFDSNNPQLLRTLMKEYGSSRFPFYGKNDEGEDIEIHISKDSIIYKTYQNNRWLRVNHFDSEGYPAGETFEGRWDK